MTPSKRRRATEAALTEAGRAMASAVLIDDELCFGASPYQAGPTPRERAEALRLATKLRDQADRLISRIMALECDDV